MAKPTFNNASTNTDGNQVILNLSNVDTSPILPSSSITGITIKVNDVSKTISSSSASGTTIAFTLSSIIYFGDIVTISYDSETGNITDSSETPNTMDSFSSNEVENKSNKESNGYTVDVNKIYPNQEVSIYGLTNNSSYGMVWTSVGDIELNNSDLSPFITSRIISYEIQKISFTGITDTSTIIDVTDGTDTIHLGVIDSNDTNSTKFSSLTSVGSGNGKYNLNIKNTSTLESLLGSGTPSTNSGYDATKVIDGTDNTSDYIYLNSGNYFQYDFGVSKLVSSYKFHSQNTYYQNINYKLEVSDTGDFSGEQTQVDSRSVGANSTSLSDIINIINPVAGRYIRFTSNYDQTFLYEIDFLGYTSLDIDMIFSYEGNISGQGFDLLSGSYTVGETTTNGTMSRIQAGSFGVPSNAPNVECIVCSETTGDINILNLNSGKLDSLLNNTENLFIGDIIANKNGKIIYFIEGNTTPSYLKKIYTSKKSIENFSLSLNSIGAYLGLNNDGSLLYVGTTNGYVNIIDTATDTILYYVKGYINNGNNATNKIVVSNIDSSKTYFSNGPSNTVSIYDGSKVYATFSTSNQIIDIKDNPNNNKIYGTTDSGYLNIYDYTNLSATPIRITLEGSGALYNIEFNSGYSKYYVYLNNKIYIINTSDNSIIKSINITLSDMKMDSTSDMLIISNEDYIYLLDTSLDVIIGYYKIVGDSYILDFYNADNDGYYNPPVPSVNNISGDSAQIEIPEDLPTGISLRLELKQDGDNNFSVEAKGITSNSSPIILNNLAGLTNYEIRWVTETNNLISPLSYQNIELWLKGGDVTDSTWNDSSGKDRSLTLYNNPTSTTQDGYPCIGFDPNSSQYASISSFMNTTESFTLFTIFNANNLSSFYGIISDGEATLPSYSLRTTNSGLAAFEVNPSSSSEISSGANASISSETWYIATCVYNSYNGTIKTYINGDLKDTVTDVTSYQATGNLNIGCFYSGNKNQYFDGYIGDTILYSRALNENEIAQISNNYYGFSGS